MLHQRPRIGEGRDRWLFDVSRQNLEGIAGAFEQLAGKCRITRNWGDCYGYLLVATGRVPNTEDLTPEAGGIHLDKDRYIQVNGQLETNVPGVYAMCDVKGGQAFTHVSLVNTACNLSGVKSPALHRATGDPAHK